MIYDSVMREVRKLLESLQKDDVGTPIGSEYVGGGGGLLSTETIHQANLVRLAMSTIERPGLQHIKRGGLYRTVAAGILQTDVPLLDMQPLVMYEAVEEKDQLKRFWFRTPDELYDTARFRVI